jgi:hypothetical protein
VSTDDTGGPARHATVEGLLDDPAVWTEVPLGLRERVLAAATGRAPGDDDREPRPTIGPAERPRHAARYRAGRRPVHRRRAPVLAAAAVVAASLGVAGGLSVVGNEPAPAVDVALAGTDQAPGARATAELIDEPAGVRVRLDVEGLSGAPAGTFYEAWLVGESGKVSAGSFHLRGDQDQIDLWLGVDPDDYDAVSVTRQPLAGGTTSEGVVVLRGDLP